MNVVHLADSLNLAMGGPPRSIVGLCENLAPVDDRSDDVEERLELNALDPETTDTEGNTAT